MVQKNRENRINSSIRVKTLKTLLHTALIMRTALQPHGTNNQDYFNKQ